MKKSSRKEIKLLSTADLVYLAKGWENARGCNIERTVAFEYGIPIMYYTDEF